MRQRRYGMGVLICLGALLLTGCKTGTAGETTTSFLMADNEIISYQPADTEKEIVTIGKYLTFDEEPIEQFLEKEFPEVDIVFVEAGTGPEQVACMALQGEAGRLPDLMFASRTAPENDFLYDLSAESFISRYNLSALNNISVDGKIYQLPLTNTIFGIAYNKTLFSEHGWEVPDTLDEFYQLCETISAEGIRPLTTSYKYYRPIESIGFGFSFDELFSTMEGQENYNAFLSGNRSSEGLLEPMFTTLRQLYEKDIIRKEDFSASATDRRHEMYAGEVAMLPGNLDVLTLYQQEKPDCEIGLMGFPTKTPGERWLHMIYGNKLSASKAAMEDPQKKTILLEILDRLSTDEGHEAMLSAFSGISSLTSYQENMSFGFDEVNTCLREGRVFFADYYASNEFVPVFEQWITGELTMEEMIRASDEADPINEIGLAKLEPIGTAEQAFTILETSSFMADVMREETGAEIALMLNNYFYKGNCAEIFKGDITLTERLASKNISAEDYLTIYEITGANLKKLMEHPIVNGAEINAMYAVSGLAMEYAPWAPADANVVSLTMADGTEIADEELYSVAAWAGAIDESYLSGVEKEFPEAGTCRKLMETAIKRAGTIAPPKDKRITLNWERR